MWKQISLAALAAATLITGSIGLAHAESAISNEDFDTSGGMQSDMRAKEAAAARGQIYSNAYGYIPATPPARSHHVRSRAKTNHNG
jgi:hypothetical protein